MRPANASKHLELYNKITKWYEPKGDKFETMQCKRNQIDTLDPVFVNGLLSLKGAKTLSHADVEREMNCSISYNNEGLWLRAEFKEEDLVALYLRHSK